MKKITLIILAVLFTTGIYAQDYIYLKDNTVIEAVVKAVNVELIKYTKFSNPEGEEFVVSPETVLKIVFSNGYVREFAKSEPAKKEVGERSEKDNYFALAAGFGRSYGGIGIRAQGRFGRNQGLGIHGGVGFNPVDAGGVCFGVGAKFFYYKWLYINAQVGIVSHKETYVYDFFGDSNYDTESVFGFSLLTGGDFVFGKHAGFNIAIGPSITGDGVKLGFDLGFVLKF